MEKELPSELVYKILGPKYLEFIKEALYSVCENNIYFVKNDLKDFGQFALSQFINDLSINLWPNCSSYVRFCNCSDCLKYIEKNKNEQQIRIRKIIDELHLFISIDRVEELLEVQNAQYCHREINDKYEWKNGNLLVNVDNSELFKKYQLLTRKKCPQCSQLKSQDSFIKYMWNKNFYNNITTNNYTITYVSTCHYCQKKNLEDKNRNFIPNSHDKKKLRKISRSCVNKVYLLGKRIK